MTDLLKQLKWEVAPPPPPNKDDRGDKDAIRRIFSALENQIMRQDRGAREMRDYITVDEIASEANASPSLTRYIMMECGQHARARFDL